MKVTRLISGTVVVCILLLVCGFKAPQEKVYRKNGGSPIDAVSLTAKQKQLVHAVDKRFAKKLDALKKKEPRNFEDRRDELNRQYSKALLAVMDKKQKVAYMEAVYRHVEGFLAAHPDVAFEDVFVWGGAYAKKPKGK